MAFGKLVVRACASTPPKRKRETPVKLTEKPSPAPEKGTAGLDIMLIAPTCQEAEDYLCGLYFNLLQALGGGRATAYTREFLAISRLSDIKQELEEIVRKPVGGTYIRRGAEDEPSLTQCTLTLGESGNTALAMDMRFVWTSPKEAVGRKTDVVLALLNCGENAETAAKAMDAARSAANGGPILWVLTNFEKKHLFWNTDGDSSLKASLRSSLCELLNISCKKDEYVVYAQTYGGLEFIGREENDAILRSDVRCRDYMPVGCHVPVMVMVEAIWKYYAHKEENAAMNAAVEKIRILMQPHYDRIKGWYDTGNEKGGGIG